MESEETKKSKYLVPEGTTHLMMWVGGALPTSRIINYNSLCGIGKDKKYEYEDVNKRYEDTRTVVDYVKTLQGECFKMQKKGESCVLVYDSKMVNNESKEQLKKIVEKIPNCYLVDYEDFAQQLKQDKNIPDSKTINSFIDHIDEIIECIKEYPNFDSDLNSIYNIGNLVDCMRMLLLLCPGKLNEIANQQGKKTLNNKDCHLLYHDFDMLQKEDVELKKSEQTKFPENDAQQLLFFSKPMEGDSGIVFENGVIFARSPNNSNDHVTDIITSYLNCLSCKNKKGLYDNIDYASIKINDFSEQYRNEGHRAWQFGRNRTESIMIEFDDDYSSVPESKFIAVINWFVENMENGESLKKGRWNEISFGEEQKEITFVNKHGKTSKVLLDDFLQNIMNHAKPDDQEKMKKIYAAIKNKYTTLDHEDDQHGDCSEDSDSSEQFLELERLVEKDKRFARFEMACEICLKQAISRERYKQLFGFDEYKAKHIEEKIDSAKNKNCVYSSIGAQHINNDNINFNISHSERKTNNLNNINTNY